MLLLPHRLDVGRDGAAYFSDFGNYRIRRVDPLTGFISTITGSGPPPGDPLGSEPNGDGSPATMELVLPQGIFSTDDPVTFSVQQCSIDPVETWGENELTTLAAYQFTFAFDTLGQLATLKFELDVTALDAVAQAVLFDLLHADAPLTLAVAGDQPGDEPKLFDICGPGDDPSSGCLAAWWLDANGGLFEPYGPIDPAALRFEALVGHFSTYSMVAVSQTPLLPGDTNGDGKVDVVDPNNVRNNFGGDEPGDTNNDGTIDIVDLNNVRNFFGVTAPQAVPEPSCIALLTITTLVLMLRRRRA